MYWWARIGREFEIICSLLGWDIVQWTFLKIETIHMIYLQIPKMKKNQLI